MRPARKSEAGFQAKEKMQKTHGTALLP